MTAGIDWTAQPERMLRVRALREAAPDGLPRRRVPQRYRVLQLALESPTGFTRWDAAFTVGCFELASRIGELESEGVTFDRITHTDKNRYGDSVQVMTYRLRYCPPVLEAHLSTGGRHE